MFFQETKNCITDTNNSIYFINKLLSPCIALCESKLSNCNVTYEISLNIIKSSYILTFYLICKTTQ